MPASKRWSGSTNRARDTWLVAHIRRSASATRPWKAGAVCATSDSVGRKTSSVRSEKPARAPTATALVGIDLEIAEMAVEAVDGEAQEPRGHRRAEDERDADRPGVGDQPADVGSETQV